MVSDVVFKHCRFFCVYFVGFPACCLDLKTSKLCSLSAISQMAFYLFWVCSRAAFYFPLCCP